MRNFKTLGRRIPYSISKYLFGDRKKFGIEVQLNDIDWKLWEETYARFYNENQKVSVGKIVNDAGYKIMGEVDLFSKKVLELGPGKISHDINCKQSPKSYDVADIYQQFLDINDPKFENKPIEFYKHLLKKNTPKLPFEDNSFDIIISFYQLEHLYPLNEYINEYKRVLKKGGYLVGAIPTEGGLLWGLGRFFTTRSWFKKNTKINPDKIICWEHPNFSDEILNTLQSIFFVDKIQFWPLKIKSLDLNLVVKFKFKKI